MVGSVVGSAVSSGSMALATAIIEGRRRRPIRARALAVSVRVRPTFSGESGESSVDAGT